MHNGLSGFDSFDSLGNKITQPGTSGPSEFPSVSNFQSPSGSSNPVTTERDQQSPFNTSQKPFETNSEEIASKEFMNKIPAFWSKCPQLWFIHFENLCKLQNIKSDVTKYQYVVAKLPQDAIMTISDVLKGSGASYDQLRQALISRNTLSEEQRLNTLLNNSSAVMGDRRPSEFYRHLEQIAGEGTGVGVDQTLLTKIWMRSLPKPLNVSLLATNQTDPRFLVAMADRIWDTMNKDSVFAIQECKPQQSDINEMKSGMSELCHQIQVLRDEINVLQERRQSFRTRQRSASNNWRGRRPYRSPSARRNPNGQCWYHSRFANAAKKCIQPCSFETDNKKN